jgi:alpha-L-fucosidase 2
MAFVPWFLILKRSNYTINVINIRKMRNLVLKSFVITTCMVLLVSNIHAQLKNASGVNKQNILWTTPSNNSKGSMPLGNGDIGINLWAEESGNICFYISKTDAWEENGRLLKIGKVNVNISPNPFGDKTSFIQTLNLYDGSIEIKAGNAANTVKFNVWVDANNPVIHLDAVVPEKTVITASAEIWRTKTDTVKKLEISDLNYFHETYGPTIIQPDVVMDIPGKIAWYHLNPEVTGFKTNLVAQGLDGFGLANPLKDRIFGAVINGAQFEKKDNKTLCSDMGQKRSLTVSVLTQHPSTQDQWLAAISKIDKKNNQVKNENLSKLHKEWWHAFWNRSWIDISCNDTITTPLGHEKQGDVLSRGYILQRFVNACGGRGNYPIKFNGSIFTVDYEGTEGFGDYRQWGTGYWWQNSRIPVLSMPASGDYEMMQPLFKMYSAQLPLAKYRTNMAFNHNGAYFPECTYFWGSVFTQSWGNKNIGEMPDRIQESGWHKYEWVCGPELATMMYDYYLYTQDEKFARETFIPLAEQVMLFFEQHYKTDQTGHLKFEPSQALETWWDCTNALPEVAGMHYLVKKIKTLPQQLLPESLKNLIARMEKALPPVPTREFEGKKMLAPAQRFESKPNSEVPELYAVFPFRLYGVGKPNIELGINAYFARTDKGNFGWRQDDLFAALLGLTGEAKTGILKRTKKWDKSQRFPAFWGPNYDWTPDQDHGGILLKTMQTMLLQCDGKEIRLLPAWPKEWDVNFKLNAPYNTTVECVYKNGKIEKLVVTPEERKKDIVKE